VLAEIIAAAADYEQSGHTHLTGLPSFNELTWARAIAWALTGPGEHFLASEGLSSKDLGLPRLGGVLSTGTAVAQAGSIAANSGRWVKLTKESAQLVDKYGLRKSSQTGLSTGHDYPAGARLLARIHRPG
jgi:hypothetical protein